MYGVTYTVSDGIRVENSAHDIPSCDIWVASYHLYQTVRYWPKGTVFISVVDPDVGGDGRSIACLTYSDHYIITPDSGSLGHTKHYEGTREVIKIDEVKSRSPHSEESHTLHGRDIYTHNSARLAVNRIAFERFSQTINVDGIEALEVREVTRSEDSAIGNIDILDIRSGSLWTNISLVFLKSLEIVYGNNLVVTAHHQDKKVYQNIIKFAWSFADVNMSEPLMYVGSLVNIGVTINQDLFSNLYHTGIGNDWIIHLSKVSSIQRIFYVGGNKDKKTKYFS